MVIDKSKTQKGLLIFLSFSFSKKQNNKWTIDINKNKERKTQKGIPLKGIFSIICLPHLPQL